MIEEIRVNSSRGQKAGWSMMMEPKIILILLMLSTVMIETKQQIYCDFNSLCLCQNYTSPYVDVTCVNVPFDTIPDVSHYHHPLYRIRLMGVRYLTTLEPYHFENLTTLASLAIVKSGLYHINPETFRTSPIRDTLTTLDLSYGNLVDIPGQALASLHQLHWLSLKGNQIEMIRSKEFPSLPALQTLLLNENLLFTIEDRSFEKFTNLELINFDGNMIERVEGRPFPLSLRSLYLSNCLLRKIPFDSIENLPRLEELHLQGNLIGHLSPFKLFTTDDSDNRNGNIKKIQLIDLSHNLISQLPVDLFANFNRTNFEMKQQPEEEKNSSIERFPVENVIGLEIEQFYLDFNFIQSLPSGLFRFVTIEKLSISNNRISTNLISPETFNGSIGKRLKVLDLNYNLIDNYPDALKKLYSLRQLYLKNNRINNIDPDSFHGCSQTLEVLDLSQNQIDSIPKMALNKLKNLIKLNLHDNSIRRINIDDFGDWCHKLRSLTLSKNNLIHLDPEAFRWCPKLNELRLGGNKMLQISPNLISKHLIRLKLFDLSSLNGVDWSNGVKTITEFLHVKWLQFDFNFLEKIPDGLLRLFPSMKHLDLQNNLINRLEPDRLARIKNLTSFILSYNNLTSVETGAFRNLTKLESITLYFNRIGIVQKGSFEFLPRLQSLVLSKNQINYIEPDAFRNLSKNSGSLTLMLDENRLRCLSIEPFRYIVEQPTETNVDHDNDEDFSLYLNVSHNQIETFANCQNSIVGSKTNNDYDMNEYEDEDDNHHDNVDDEGNDSTTGGKTMTTTATDMMVAWSNQPRQTLAVRVLDISHNRITNFNKYFLWDFCQKTFSLFANNNLIHSLSVHLFELCPQLQTLSLNHNHISDSGPENFYSSNSNSNNNNNNNSDDQTGTIEATNKTFSLQTLSLEHNQIKDLIGFANIFNRTHQLKQLSLSHNRIVDVPSNFFRSTSIVSLNLAHNKIFDNNHPDDKCFGISRTLKFLDLSHNRLKRISQRILFCQQLNELIISNNHIYTFNYNLIKPGTGLYHLRRLELNQNPLESKMGFQTLQFLSNHSILSTLNLNNLNISELDELNVPYLYSLDLSDNNINRINTRILSRTRNIRNLNLARNRIPEIPKHIWKYVTRLQDLNLSENPIDILDSSSFAGLKYLRYLDIRGLNLQYIDSRIFIYQSQMISLKISTYPQIRSFRLQDILSKCDSLKSIMVDIKEEILSHQIQWAFGGKLRELIITGSNLQNIVPDAFQGLNNASDLILRITNTSIRHLPDGLLRYLADIRYITIDLRNNHLETIRPSVFFNVDLKHSLKSWQSRQLLGGIILENNPLQCDCNLMWVSQWMKEVFTEMKSINVEAAIHAKSTLSLSRCQTKPCHHRHRNPVPTEVSIIDLRPEDICENCNGLVNQPHQQLSVSRAKALGGHGHHFLIVIFISILF